jgi:hypothetical protein|tara:strand:- start:639 stop:890 length:252 start_codon:yes stop_codon:yes gene_type:complete
MALSNDLFVHHRIRSEDKSFSSSSSKTSPNLLHPGALSAVEEEEKERHNARARATTKRERYKKTERKTPRTEKKTREETRKIL